jgi:hypothetical protein
MRHGQHQCCWCSIACVRHGIWPHQEALVVRDVHGCLILCWEVLLPLNLQLTRWQPIGLMCRLMPFLAASMSGRDTQMCTSDRRCSWPERLPPPCTMAWCWHEPRRCSPRAATAACVHETTASAQLHAALCPHSRAVPFTHTKHTSVDCPRQQVGIPQEESECEATCLTLSRSITNGAMTNMMMNNGIDSASVHR